MPKLTSRGFVALAGGTGQRPVTSWVGAFSEEKTGMPNLHGHQKSSKISHVIICRVLDGSMFRANSESNLHNF